MSSYSNNIFDYATSELSQDAFIRYCLEFYNTNDVILKSLSESLLKSFNRDIDFTKVSKLKIYQQYEKIDILIVLSEINQAIIIEDKVDSNEHDNQIERYKEKIRKLSENDNRLSITENVHITTVYFKTGYINDDDRYIEYKAMANVFFKREDFLNLLQKYIRYDYIIENYYYYLKTIDDNEKKIDFLQNNLYDNDGKQIPYWEWNIATSNVCQQKLMRDIFNEEKYKYDFDKNLFYLWSGSSFGRPFTEFDVFEKKQEDKNKLSFSLFWRIDTDTYGPYLALRLYGRYESELQKNEKIEWYNKLRSKSEELIGKLNIKDFNWDSVKKYKNGNGGDFESTLVHFSIGELLLKWNDKTISDEFKSKVKEYHDNIIDYTVKITMD